jgi:hypothetical protein
LIKESKIRKREFFNAGGAFFAGFAIMPLKMR